MDEDGDSVYEGFIEPHVEEGSSSLDTPEQRKLREQIAFHVAQASKLKRDLNSCNPVITGLPPEILAEVFLCQAAILRKERVELHAARGEAEIHQPFYRWLNIAHICHHWREVALNCATLWTWIAFEERIDVQYIQDLVARARGLPLTVILTVNSPGLHCDSCIDPDSFYHNGSCALHYVKELLPRIRELLLFVEKDFDTDNIWESLDEPAPLLETLRVEAMRGAQYQPSHPHGATVYLPKAVFQHQAPKLRSIYVGGVRIHFSSRVLGASLRKLAVVSCQCSQFGAAPDFVQWQLMLHRMPLLEELEIDGSVPFGDDGGTYNTVSLPNLKELRISADVDAFVGHIMHLNLPSSTAIFLIYKPKPSAAPSEELLAQLRSAISKLFKNISPERITYRGLDPDEPEELVSCHIWAKPTSQQDGKPAPPLSINSLAVPDRPPRFVIQSESKYRMEALAPVIVAALDVSSVHTVDIGDFSMGNRWAPILQGAVNVQVLRAHGTAAFGVPTILGRTDTNSVQVDPTDKFYWMGFVADEASVEEHGDHPNTHSPAAVEDVDMTEPNSEGAKSPHADPAVSGRKAIPLFPNLTTLEFVDLDLQVPVGGYPPPCPHASMTLLMFFQAHKAKYGLSIEAIHKCIRMRQAKGAAVITSVRFHGCCCADLAYLEPLAQTVPDVYWDGVRVSSASIAESI